GATVTQDTEIDMNSQLNMLMNEAQSLSNGRHRISLEADTSIWLSGAAEELHSALGNLVSNAIRYTPEGGEIKLNWRMRGQEAVFSVQYSGIGIEQKHIDRLTERFYRVDRSRSRETGGTGLGLSIVKHILTRHQAKLEIESVLDKGSTFSVVFPKSRLVIKQPD
ncbi:MAG: ATP-binding protein, partial [Nitrosomonadales bacterium]|nr:ATP-binding protein [Nitrosomonadales bacterium]